MALYPNADYRPLDPEQHTAPYIEPRTIVLHSAVDSPGPTSLHPYFNRRDVYVESHFFVKLNGQVEQYQDTGRQADAQYRANGFAISIETEDEGNPDERPWTEAQLESIADIIRWCHRIHGVPLRRCRDPYDAGIGYHTMWGAPSEWTPVRGKTCPGAARKAQFADLLNRVGNKEERDVVQKIPAVAVALLVDPKGGYAQVDHKGGVFPKNGFRYAGSVPELVRDGKIPSFPPGVVSAAEMDPDGEGYMIQFTSGHLFTFRWDGGWDGRTEFTAGYDSEV